MKFHILYRHLFVTIFLGLILGEVGANNILISDGPFFRRIGTGQAEIQYGVMWENSWHFRQIDTRQNINVINWDAAWIFGKYSINNGPWHHLYLDNNSASHRIEVSNVSVRVQIGTSMVEGTNRAMGIFIHRDTAGSGTIQVNKAFLRWNYGEFGVSSQDADEGLRLRLFAIEMVYIPPGPFWFGDCAFPGRVNVGDARINLNYTSAFNLNGDIVNATAANCADVSVITAITGDAPLTFRGEPILSSFPRGEGFYIMKYPITQAAWVDFLNTLTYTQQVRRTTNMNPAAGATTFAMGGNGAGNRNWVRIRTAGVAATQVPAIYGHTRGIAGPLLWDRDANGGNIAMTFLSVFDGLAYADWSGLRPMTELEFEKAARGLLPPRTGEFAWGGRVPSEGTNMQFEWTGRETLTGNFRSINGAPVRVGAFAHHWTNRQQSGGSFYGVMNMSDNVWERVISLQGGSTFFDGRHGDGRLADNGDADVETWPNTTDRFFGWGTRGHQVSNRSQAETTGPETPAALRPGGLSHFGFRAVRTAP
jgi:formylglycine-generating enzyme required for sulfatase activity